MYEIVTQVQAYAGYAKKAVIGFSTAALAVVAYAVPDYSDEASYILSAVIALLGAIAQYRAENGPDPSGV